MTATHEVNSTTPAVPVLYLAFELGWNQLSTRSTNEDGEPACPFTLGSWHGRGWTDSYLLRVDGRVAGCGLVGGVRSERKKIITEFFVLASHGGSALRSVNHEIHETHERSEGNEIK